MIYEANHLYNYVSGFAAEKAIKHSIENKFKYIAIKKEGFGYEYDIHYLNSKKEAEVPGIYDVIFEVQEVTRKIAIDKYSKTIGIYSEYGYIEEKDQFILSFKKTAEINKMPAEKIQEELMVVGAHIDKETGEILSICIPEFSKYNKIGKMKGLDEL